MSRFPWSLAVSAGLLTAAAAGYVYVERKKPPLGVEVVKVERGDVRELVPSAAAGQVKAIRRVTIRAEAPGTITHVERHRGDRVKRGEPVIRFDDGEIAARIAQAEANVEAAAVAKKIAVSRQESAKRSLERAKKLREGGAIPSAELERAETELETLGHSIEQASAAARQAEAALRLVRLQREKTVVIAPFDGLIFDLSVELGTQVSLGATLFDLIDDSGIVLEIPVDESDADKVKLDQEVMLHLESSRDDALVGRVSYVPPAVGRAQAGGALEAPSLGKRDRSVYVEVSPKDPARFRIGASVNAEFLVGQRTGVLYLPSHVVIGRGLAREVYVLDGGRAKKRGFQAGLTSWDRTEVLSGLDDGQSVIASLNLKELSDGTRVQASSAPPAERAEAPR